MYIEQYVFTRKCKIIIIIIIMKVTKVYENISKVTS